MLFGARESTGTMFEKTVTDMIRGIRANKKNEAKYISMALEEIRKEIRSGDLDVKANAVNKLVYVRALLARSA